MSSGRALALATSARDWYRSVTDRERVGMKRRLGATIAMTVLVIALSPASPASADVAIEAQFCVSPSYFTYVIGDRRRRQ